MSTNTIKQEERRSAGTTMAGRIAGISRMVGKSYITGEAEVDARQEVELEVGRA
jgi:hypothetical protein